MSSGSLRLKEMAILVVFFLVLSVTKAENEESLPNESDGRLYFNNQNSTLIPLGTGGSLLISTVGVIALVIGSVFLISLIFHPTGWKNGGIFSPWLSNTGYPASGYQQSQYYTQQQAQPYLYEPYSKLGYQSQPVAR